MARHFKIDDLLPDDQHAEFLQLVLHRATTVDAAWSWLRKRGHKVSRGAVHHWMQHARDQAADPALPLRAQLTTLIQSMTLDQLRALHAHLSPPTTLPNPAP